jgi:polysaccharide biosynthesis protein PslG
MSWLARTTAVQLAIGAVLSVVVAGGFSLTAYKVGPAAAIVPFVVAALLVAVVIDPLVGIIAGVLAVPLETLALPVGAVGGITPGEVLFGIAAASAVLAWMNGATRPRPAFAHWAFLALLLISATGLAFAADAFTVFRITFMWSIFLVLSIYLTTSDPRQLRAVLCAIAVSGVVVSLIALSGAGKVKLLEGGEIAEHRAQASFAHPAVLAFFLVMAFPCALCLGLAGRGLRRWALIAGAALILGALMLTLTRGAIVAVGVVLALLLVWQPFRKVIVVLLASVAAFTAINGDALLRSHDAALVTTRLATIGGQEAQTNPRIRIYKGAPSMLENHPLLGVGAGNFPDIAARYDLRDLDGSVFEHAHDVPLTVAIELGLLGLAALGAFAAAVAGTCVRALRARDAWFDLRLAAVSGIVGLTACSILDYPLRTNVIVAVFMLEVGVLMGLRQRQLSDGGPPRLAASTGRLDRRRLMAPHRVRCVAAVVAVTALPLLTGSASGAQIVGVNAHLLWSSVTAAEMAHQLDLSRGAGAGIVRVDVGWSSLELTGKGHFSSGYLSRLDTLVDEAGARGLRLMLTLSDSPCWASSAPAALKDNCSGAWWDRGVQRYAPVDVQDYADALGLLVRRYGGRVYAWETWNEPNSPDYYVSVDPAADYTALVKAAYRTVKATDPGARLIAGAVMQSDYEFVERLYAAGIKGYFDALSIHPYCEDRSPLDPGSDGYIRLSFIRGVPAVHDVMLRNGDDRPIWLTEFGWSTTTTRATPDLWRNGVDEDAQARYVAAAVQQLPQWPYVAGALDYTLIDRGGDPTRLNDNYGLVRLDGTPKPAYEAFRLATSSIGDAP